MTELPIEPDAAGPSVASREPLLNRAAITSLVTVGVALLAVFGLPVDEGTQEAVITVLVLLAGLPPLVVGWWSRRHVTPAADPRTEDGRSLVAVPLGGVVNVTFPHGRPDLTNGG